MAKDGIDRFETAWTSAYPDLDPWPLRIFGRVIRLADILEKQGNELRQTYGVHLGEVQVLAALRRALPDFTATPKELSQLTLVTSAAVTSRLNSLEAKGLISREIDQRSRRRILVTLTDEGIRLIESYIRTFVSNQAKITEPLSDTERVEYVDMLRKLLTLVGDGSKDADLVPNVPQFGLI